VSKQIFSSLASAFTCGSETGFAEINDDFLEADFWPGALESLFRGITSGLPVTRAFQETSRFSGRRHELITPNGVVRNCELLVIGLRLFFGKIDHDDLRVFA
jgi:hypothetical protein